MNAWSNKSTIAVITVAVLTCTTQAARFKSLAPYLNEAEAVAVGEKIGIGSAILEGPKTAEVMSRQTWTLVYTVGPAGIAPGGGIRIGMRHVVQWTPPQVEKPAGPGYTTVVTTPDVPTKVSIESGPYKRFGGPHFPWQNMLEVLLPEQGLKPGHTIRVTYGDTSGGSTGMRIQPFDEEDFTFKVYVDAAGDQSYLPLAQSPTIDIVSAEPYRLGMVMPSDAVAGETTWCIVRAEDHYGNPATRYRGTITFSSNDRNTNLPPGYTFTEDDAGVHRFDGITFNTPGIAILRASDRTFEREANPVRVTEDRPEQLLLWGDLHGHTLNSDGRGTVEQFYDFAERVAGLDFCAVTDHAFEMTDAMWEHSKKVTEAVNKPERFVTFQAYEWSGQMAVGGDHNIFFLDDDPPIIRSRTMYDYRNLQMYHGSEPQLNHIEDLFVKLAPMSDDKEIFCIPHWGGRHGNPNWHNDKVQRMVEVFSEHRRSEDWMKTFLTRGYRLGIMASTDGHYGNPGYGYLKPTYDWTKQEIGMASVAVYTPKQTRKSIFRSLYDRQVYATSGDRIILDFRADGHIMGSEYRSTTPPTLTVDVAGTDTITAIEIKKDCEVVHTVKLGKRTTRFEWRDPDFEPTKTCFYYVRVLQANNEEAISSPIWVN